MKPCIIVSLSLSIALTATAQHKPLTLDLKPWKPGRLYLQQGRPPGGAVTMIPLQDSVKGRLYQQQEDTRWIQGGVKATYSHETARGKVYTLTPDNMPCLAPDMQSVSPMPNKRGLFVRDKSSTRPIKPIIPPADDKQP